MLGVKKNEIGVLRRKRLEETSVKTRAAHTVRLTPEIYKFLYDMSEETGVPISTLVHRGLTIGIKVSAVLEVGDDSPWEEQTMTAKPVELTAKQPAQQISNWSGRVFAISGNNGPIPEDEVVGQGIRRNKGEL